MATRKTAKHKTTEEPRGQQVSFSVRRGARLRITVEVGKEEIQGELPVTINVEETESASGAASTRRAADGLRRGLDALRRRFKQYDLPARLFAGALAVYLLTRLIGLTQFPIYFLSDEAIQTQSVVELIENGYSTAAGGLLPTYFRNGEYYNLGASVYMQWLPYVLFGKSAFVTRAASVLLTLIAAVSVGLILRDVLKIKTWWTGTLFLSITPTWFLHSRTALETAEFVAFYAGALCAYLLYRYRSPRYLFLAVLLGALAFYTYAPGQLIVPITAAALLVSDWRYHMQQRVTALVALALAALLAVPYLRYRAFSPDAPLAHLHVLGSYLMEPLPVGEKIVRYLAEYGTGLSPWYWYIPNNRDLPRHLMKDYGHILLATLPLALLGLLHALRNWRDAGYRAVLIVMLAAPVATALVQASITRTLTFVIPAALLTAVGLDRLLAWIGASQPAPGGPREAPSRRIAALRSGPGPGPGRWAAAALIVLAGLGLAFAAQQLIDRIVLVTLAAAATLQVSGLPVRLAGWLERIGARVRRAPSAQTLSLTVFAVLAGVNLLMLGDALRDGPLWFRDYGMGGMQYGAFQIFDEMQQYRREHPQTEFVFSPDWANGTDVVLRFFLDEHFPVRVGSIHGPLAGRYPFDDQTVFVMVPTEYELARSSSKLTDVRVEKVVPYPDGSPGFYFVRLRYAEDVDALFEAERAARQVLQESTAEIDGQVVQLRYSYLDSPAPADSIALVFDHDPYSLAKTFESNPFVIEMEFSEPRRIEGFSIIIGSAAAEITITCIPTDDGTPVRYTFTGQGSIRQPELAFDLPESVETRALRLEMRDQYAPDDAQIHIWELTLR